MTSQTWIHAVAALVAVYMLVRHLPGARAVFGKDPRSRTAALASAVNVLLALAILVVAVKGLVARLISG